MANEITEKQIVALDIEFAHELRRFLGNLPYDLVKANESIIEKFSKLEIINVSQPANAPEKTEAGLKAQAKQIEL